MTAPAVELCSRCQKPMADGGAPVAGAFKGAHTIGPYARRMHCCASCHRLIAAEPTVKAEIEAGVRCHHGIRLEEDCWQCEDEILDQGFDG